MRLLPVSKNGLNSKTSFILRNVFALADHYSQSATEGDTMKFFVVIFLGITFDGSYQEEDRAHP